jgi:uncharacterized membrane protein YfcA
MKKFILAKVMSNFELLLLFLIVMTSFLYSSVGHGGASGYLALMVIFDTEPSLMKSSALLLNLIVSGIAFHQYYRNDYFQWKLFFPFALSSVPMAFIGARLPVDSEIYHKILAVCLIFAVLRILNIWGNIKQEKKELPFIIGVSIGAILGFVSGMIGIGGGIILSPILLILNLSDMKETAAVSSLFIFVNSAAGLGGIIGKINFMPQMYLWVIAAIIGGTAGAYYGSKKFNTVILKYFLACVLIFASTKLFMN